MYFLFLNEFLILHVLSSMYLHDPVQARQRYLNIRNAAIVLCSYARGWKVDNWNIVYL